MDPLPPSWAVAADGANIESAKQTRNVTTRGMRAPWFDPDGGNATPASCASQTIAGFCGCFGVRNASALRSAENACVFGCLRPAVRKPRTGTYQLCFVWRTAGGEERGQGSDTVSDPGREGCTIGAMRPVVLVAMLAAGLLRQPQEAAPKDWIDADTGHRVVRLTGEAGGSTLYFHDNAFSPDGDRLIVNTPDGIAMIDVAKIGTDAAKMTVIAPRARGGYFARRTREIYINDSARGAIVALNVDTKASREVPHARGLINTDETLSMVKNANATDPDGTHPKPPTRTR